MSTRFPTGNENVKKQKTNLGNWETHQVNMKGNSYKAKCNFKTINNTRQDIEQYLPCPVTTRILSLIFFPSLCSFIRP